MAKGNIGRNRNIVRSRREILNYLLEKEEIKKFREDHKIQPSTGIKQKVIDVYEKTKDKQEVYKVVQSFNEKIGKEAFSKDIVDQWLEAYEKSTIKLRKEDDDAR